jgi:D-sedoheptulose 7-phosphate isomerase
MRFDAVQTLIGRYPALEPCAGDVAHAVERLGRSFKTGHKLLICGNGGSAADAVHIVGELMKSFKLRRPIPSVDRERLLASAGPDGERIADLLQGALPAVALTSELALMTAYANDVAPDLVFAQQVYGYGRPGDTLLAISTSGNSLNVVLAARVARAFDVTVVALTGAGGGELAEVADVAIKVPADKVHEIQEYHLPVYHAICLAVEEEFFGVHAAAAPAPTITGYASAV